MKQLIKIKYYLLSSLLFFLVLSVSLTTAAESGLKPTLAQAIAAINTVQILSRHAYESLPLNNKASDRFLKAYLNTLDPQKSFFLLADIAYLKKNSHRLIHDLKKGKIERGFSIFELYRQHYIRYLSYQLKLINDGLQNLNFNSKRELYIDRKNMQWLADTKSQYVLWKKQLINTVINEMLNGKNMSEISIQLKNRYQNQLHQLNQINAEDVFQLYINAFTMLYDPHTQYFSPLRAQNFNIDMSLSFEGIGAILQYNNGHIKIEKIISGGPVAKTGHLKPGDKIIAIAEGVNGKFKDIVGMRLNDVVKLLRGPKGSIVRLEVISSDQQRKAKIYSVVRDIIKLKEQSAKAKTFMIRHNNKNYKIGILQIPGFYLDFKAFTAGKNDYKSTTRDVKELLKKLKNENVDGIIIDLRGNSGGSLQEAIDLTGLFIPASDAVIARDNQQRTERFFSKRKNPVYTGLLAVLVDRLSASASEIFTAAMQDYNRAIIIGSKTYGKGSVQTLQPLNEGQLKFTVAKFYRVSGKSIQNKGIVPDIEFPALFDDEAIGENTLLNALPWDIIKPTSYKPLPSLQKKISCLNKNFKQREKLLPFFQYVKSLRLLNKKQKSKETTISLNLKNREKEFYLLQNEYLAIKNQFRKQMRLPLLESVDDVEKKHSEFVPPAAEKENSQNDAFINEALVIFSDYIEKNR
ncbi:MAG: carboxy terminal-processing peptidase [Endozoicomonadaceae bacterium]|nr:carboxy terminal-processing peptidase [Endozoicomonadaceae bacterium]